MLATKGYGFSVEDIDWSSPADMKPYLKAHKEELREKDTLNWYLGQYVMSALDSTVCNSWPWRGKNSQPHSYIKKPILKTQEMDSELTEDEQQKAVDLFFAKENARRINWKRNKAKGLPESPE